ncbi:MAG: aconitate hydratase [candidate division WS1 bacterium]|jgi:aconitate hydratase|nr:aconitate hydratase [candidate division WS1 bacterium]
MPATLTEKIIARHIVSGEMTAGSPIDIRIAQTLTQDATGTMAYLQFEAMGVERVQTDLSVSYVDHNTLQTGFENADDHRYLQSVAAKHGIYFSRPGNGICHQVHLERFGMPGGTLLGSDSHTPTGGGIGMLAIGAGGLDVAAAMAGEPFSLNMPEVIGVRLEGELQGWASAKDVILELLRRLSVKGGVGRVFEYFGPGVATLSVPERATITNMGAELGATSSIFPSDEVTRQFLRAQQREDAWSEQIADEDAPFAEVITIDLSAIKPLVAQPHMPDEVVPVSEIAGLKVDQVCIGSCTNSSLKDLMTVAAILKGRTVHEHTSLVVSPGSRQVEEMIARNGALADLLAAGARVLEPACGPCIGMGQAPPTGGVSVRTFNRNFLGRSGTADAGIYLTSPEIAAAVAISGEFVDPSGQVDLPAVELPEVFTVDDSMIIPPPDDPSEVEVVRGPNIQPIPLRDPIPESFEATVLLKVGDNITTDDIMPAGAKILPLRSNIPAISQFVFSGIDPEFASRAEAIQPGLILGGQNYGQGSSREHAALAPLHLGIRAVLAESFARIHKANLVNFGIAPLEIAAADYEALEQGAVLRIEGAREAIAAGKPITAEVVGTGRTVSLTCDLSEREREILLAGGRLNHIRQRRQGA